MYVVSGRQAAQLVVGVHHSYFQSMLNFTVHFCLSVNSRQNQTSARCFSFSKL